MDDLWRFSSQARKGVAVQLHGSSSSQLDRELHEATQLEVQRVAQGAAPGRGSRQGAGVLDTPPALQPLLRHKTSCDRRCFCLPHQQRAFVVEAVDPDGLDRIARNVKAHMDAFTVRLGEILADSLFAGVPRSCGSRVPQRTPCLPWFRCGVWPRTGSTSWSRHSPVAHRRASSPSAGRPLGSMRSLYRCSG